MAHIWGKDLPSDPLVRLALVDGTFDFLKRVTIAYQFYRVLHTNVSNGH